MTPVKVCSICTCAIVGFGNNAQPINEGRCCDQCNAARHSCAAVAGAKREATRSTSASDLFERLRGLERFGRRWPEAVQRELCLLRGLNVHEEVVVLFFWRLPFPIEVGWIIRQNLDGRAPWENWVRNSAAIWAANRPLDLYSSQHVCAGVPSERSVSLGAERELQAHGLCSRTTRRQS